MSTRALLHVTGKGATTLKAESIIALLTDHVMTKSGLHPMCAALLALLHFTFLN